MKKFIVFGVIVLISVSCKKTEEKPDVDWHEYAMFSSGIVRTYECTSINIDVLAGIKDTSIFYIQETVGPIYSDTLSCDVYAISQIKRNDDETTWSAYSSYCIQSANSYIVRVENNTPYKILQFPASTNFSWDLNIFNTNDEQQVHYSDINSSMTIHDTSYDSVLTVLQQDFKSLYTYQFAVEQYAKGFGLIYKKDIDVESQPNHATIDLSLPVEERITKGTIVSLELVDIQRK